MSKKRSLVLGLAAAVAAVLPTTAVVPAAADVLIVSDVAASLSAPASANGAFAPTGTITNTGTIEQPEGSLLTFTAAGGAVSSAPEGCAVSDGTAVCTVGPLAPGDKIDVKVGVTPDLGATSVSTTVTVEAAVFEQNVLDPTNNTATLDTSIAYEVGAALSNQPTDVKYGAHTLLTATVTNRKAPQRVDVLLASGGTGVDTRVALPSECATTNDGKDVACSFVLITDESRIFDVAVKVPTSGSSITSTLTATGAAGGEASASVQTNLFNDAQAFVPEGEFLAYQGSNQFTKFNVPVGSTQGGGTFLQLRDVTLDNVKCGTATCMRLAAEAIFPSAGKYSGQDPNKPYIWEIKYDERQTCNGNGNGSGCLIDLYWIATGESTTRPMALCPTYGTSLAPRLHNIDEPCLVKAPQKSQKGYATYTVAVLRDIVIPIISSNR